MSDVISGIGSTLSGTATGDRTVLGQNDFMKLLVTQLRNQDPLSPLEPQEFATQLAGFSTVEELSQIQADMAAQLASSRTSAVLSQTTFGAALLGRRVLAEGDQVQVGADGGGEIQVEVGDGGGDATLRILDAAGAEVASRHVGTVEAGRQTIALPEGLEAGTYTYELSVTDASGQPVSVTSYVSGIVDRLLFENGAIQLCLGDLRIVLDALVEVAPATRAQL